MLLLSGDQPLWHYNIDEAKQIASREHRLILLNFSGSDWCGPCIRMHKEIFSLQDFINLAGTNLVLVNADFPRMKKNQLGAQQQQINNAMADRYNPKGRFPLTILLDPQGNVLKEWDGFPAVPPEGFISEVRDIVHAKR